MGDFWKKMLSIDRRIIFLFMALSIIVPSLIPGFILPVTETPMTRNLFDFIEELPEGSFIWVSMDFDPTASPELTPQTLALLKHAFRKKHKVVAMTLWMPGLSLGLQNLQKASQFTYQDKNGNTVEVDAKEYEDWVYLGTKVGGPIVIKNLCDNVKKSFPQDHRGKPLETIELMKNIKKLSKDTVSLVVSISAGVPGIDQWITIGKGSTGFNMAGGCTGVSATQFFPFLQSGQLIGLMAALKGGSEYEHLLNDEGVATRRMSAQTVAHLVIILFVIIGNIAFFVIRERERSEG